MSANFIQSSFKSSAESLSLQRYKKHIWQPFTQMKLIKNPILIERGEGVYLYTKDNKAIIDAVGSWWVNIHGHNHPYVNQKIEEQLHKIEHLLFSNLYHEPAINLATSLSLSTKNVLPRSFFSDNGSTGVEIALKMAYQYFHNKGRKEKTKFVTFHDGYHGDTIGAMSVGARSSFHEIFNKLFFPCYQIAAPTASYHQELSGSDESIEELKKLLEEKSHEICAFILEPIVQAASAGFRIYSPMYLKKIRDLCNEYDILMIADEVFTGCGRTGTFYAYEQSTIVPDIVVLSKGLSAGYLPFAVTLSTESIFQTFYSDDRTKAFLHGHSMTANPLSCAAACASLELFQKENTLDKVRQLENMYKERLFYLEGESKINDCIKETRFLGAIAVIELNNEMNYTDDLPWQMMEKFLERGVLIRPLANTIYLTPPYCITEEQLDEVFNIIEEVVYSFYY